MFKIKFQDQNGNPISVHINGLFDDPVDHIIINPNIDYSSVIPGYTHRWRYPNEDVNDLLRVIKADPANATLFDNYTMESRIKSNGNTNDEQGYKTGGLYFPDNISAEPAFASDDGYYPTEYYLTFNSGTGGQPYYECTTDADCGAGICDSSGMCQCDANANKNGGKCMCKEGFIEQNDACICPSNSIFISETGECIPTKFTITTTDDTTSFDVWLHAGGDFYLDCGNGQTFVFQDLNPYNSYSEKCTYDTPGTQTIRLGGQATSYDPNRLPQPVLMFGSNDATKIKTISGSLGALFPTIDNGELGKNPMFGYLFYNATNLESIPTELFDGITGQPVPYMFEHTFQNCTKLTSIPTGLFSGLNGTPTPDLFSYTFSDCSGLTGSIPSGLFGNLTGAPASGMFSYTFSDCSGLTGSIPSGLFGNLTGAPASGMFNHTFSGCSGLTGSIPSGLFGNLAGDVVDGMFDYTFRGCNGLTGSIPSGLFGNLTGAPVIGMFKGTFFGCSGLTGQIPNDLFGEITGERTTEIFWSTFENCTNLTGYVPTSIYSGLTGTSRPRGMFYNTFYNCNNMLTQSDNCPTGTTKIETGYETNYWNNHIACKPN